jgi:hypothetical protein
MRVESLLPNPFRDMRTYPIDREKVDNLKISMNKTGFWDNMIARPSEIHEGKFEFPYGHHRFIALMELGIEEIDINIKDLSDVEMIQIMADENFEYGQKDIRVVNETVSSVKKYIENHISAKNVIYEDLDDWCKDLWYSKELFDRGAEQNGQTPQVGRVIIQKFLGDNWSKSTIQISLKVLSGEETAEQEIITSFEDEPPTSKKATVHIPISREAVELFTDVGHARAFVETITRDPDCRSVYPTEEAQVAVAKKVIETSDKITSSGIKEQLHELAQERIDTSTPILTNNSSIFLEVLRGNNKSKVLFKEIGKISDRIKTIPDFTQQRVLTKIQVQSILNEYQNMIYNLCTNLEDISKYFNMSPDEMCVQYDCFPSVNDFNFINPDELTAIGTEIEEIDYENALDEEEQIWIDHWLKGRTESIDEND